MTRDEMDAAIRIVVGEREIANTNSRAFKRWRRIYLAGMRTAADIAGRADRAAECRVTDLTAASAIRLVAEKLET